jgi:short-subunit dehydrogenase
MFRENVQVLSVQPGFVYTRMTENLTLPPLLTAKPEDIANGIFKAVKSGKNVVYIKWFWRYIMLIIRNIPEFIFKKLKL